MRTSLAVAKAASRRSMRSRRARYRASPT